MSVNHQPISHKLFAIIFISLLSITSNVSGDTKKIDPINLETITITASKTPIDILNTGSSVRILDQTFIQQTMATSVAELLRAVAGLQVNQQGSRGAVTQIRVRGAEANQLLVLIDGVEANDIAQGGEFNFAHLMTHQIERIEIVRGPQSALWGSDALSGVINIITFDNEVLGSSAEFQAEAGSFQSQNTGMSFNHGSEKTQLKLSVHKLSTEGTNISRQGEEDDGYENTSFALNARVKLSERVSVEGMLRQTDSMTEFDAIDYFSTGLPYDAPHQTDSEQFYARLKVEMDSPTKLFTQRFSLARTETDNENDTGGLINNTTKGLKDQIQYQGNLFLVNQNLSLIAEYETEDYRQRGADLGFGNPNRDLNIDTNSLAIEYRFNGESWHFSASLRQDNNSDFDSINTYRVTANWQMPIENFSVFSSFGRASKNPSFTERFGYFDNFLGNPDLIPETSDSWEVGLRNSFREGSIKSSLSFFNAALENEINGFVFDAASGGFTAKNSDADSYRQGTELEVSWLASDQLSMQTSYTYLDSSFENSFGKKLDEVRRPRHIASLNGNYHWEKANLNLAIHYNGRQLDDFFPPWPASPERVSLKGYTLINLAGSYQFSDKLALSARIENSTDAQYEEVFGFKAPGLAAYAGLKFNW